jgi:mannonate dehydratase
MLSTAPTASAAFNNWPLVEGPSTPKLALGVAVLEPDSLREVKQLGVSHVFRAGPTQLPWQETELKVMMDTCKAAEVSLSNLMISGFPHTIYGRAGRDQEIENVQKSIRAAGKVGLPVVEYNFYAHRAMEGYYMEPGRAGSGYTAFDYDRMKNLGPKPEEGAHS